MNARDYTRMKKAGLRTTPGCPEGSDDAFDLVEALERLAEGRAVELIQVFRQHVRTGRLKTARRWLTESRRTRQPTARDMPRVGTKPA